MSIIDKIMRLPMGHRGKTRDNSVLQKCNYSDCTSFRNRKSSQVVEGEVKFVRNVSVVNFKVLVTQNCVDSLSLVQSFQFAF